MCARAIYPVCLDLRGRRCVVVGGGAVAERKARGLAAAGARVTVVAKTARGGLGGLARGGRIVLRRRPYAAAVLRGAFLCIAATDDPAVNARVSSDARRGGVLVNVADAPGLCDFFLPSVAGSGALRIAVSTGGGCPALAKRLGEEIGARYGKEYGVLLDLLDRMRRRVIAEVAPRERAALLRRLSGAAVLRTLRRQGKAAARARMERIIRAALKLGGGR